jgi:hypothetical protein
MEEVGQFRKDQKADDRGKFLFGPQPDKNQSQIGNSILRLVLESISAWARWYPGEGEPSEFYSVYCSLVMQGV